MKTDSIFYRIFQEFPGLFFELIGNQPQTAENYQFSSVELKQTAFRIDGIFLPQQGESSPIYFVEVQFQSDPEIYSRLFSEIHLYLRQNKSKNPWRGFVIFPNRSLDTGDINNYSEYFASHRVRRIYVDELGEAASLPVGIATIKLVVEDEETAIITARELIERTQQSVNVEQQRRQLLELIETILVYKFPTMSRKEIESMFGLSDLQQTRVYQEAREEGSREEKLKIIPFLLRLGASVSEIAKELSLSVEEVQQVIQEQPRS
ncbi:MAG: Rpn family recombination-promoting nuclease/putative transposase [Calothrix sp. SM1_7_51]|nr:Rpn family recombination-promoting nuclease/putative transposase [Calothrix sp. SM1_7_51]